jgi:hypothetical protein
MQGHHILNLNFEMQLCGASYLLLKVWPCSIVKQRKMVSLELFVAICLAQSLLICLFHEHLQVPLAHSVGHLNELEGFLGLLLQSEQNWTI